ncbi:protein phosphatase 2C domain-containing protein [Azospirillum sp. A1-3]|uniref:PP2C family protein-serine/threonine phosphatase n=1 Tax=Azospirillum sp. A1-3 TaxID=185874 RepID=UPI0020774DA5|nr:protein phosphatase 2C domain-containing protein [Azospirillum sp. A1-3]MCM8738887.1 protein phosphatase 2C domain-containing protein [Azospirillum sp. A1-3]
MIEGSQTVARGGPEVRSSSATHQGCVRSLNEDSLLERPDLGLWVVADGMGGHQRGEYASDAIVRTLGAMPTQVAAPAFMTEVKSRLEGANALLRAQGLRDGGTIASTVVCLLISGWNFACVWAGDSRLYLLRDGRLHRVSTDHSVVQDLVDAGALTPEQAATHPRGNEVTRAVGAFDRLTPEVRQGTVQSNDVFLLCSDGLTRMIADDEIAALACDGEGEPAPLVDALIAETLRRGASDNVTVIVVRCLRPTLAAEEIDTLVLSKRPTALAADQAAAPTLCEPGPDDAAH